MSENDSAAVASAPAKVIRDKEFAKRLEMACEKHPRCPTNGRGKQKWLYDTLREKFNVTVSPEAARKWFAGESRPRPKVMSLIAQVLEVDEAWLSLGITPYETPFEKKRRNAIADGAVNYVAGLIQMAGGHIAFPEQEGGKKHEPDIYAIIKGKQYLIEVKQVQQRADGEMRVRVPASAEEHAIIAVIETKTPMQFDIVQLPSEVIAKEGRGRGGFIEVALNQSGSEYAVGDQKLVQITDFSKLETIAA